MSNREKQFMDRYDKYLEEQFYTIGLTHPIIPDSDEKTLQEVAAVIDAELAKIP